MSNKINIDNILNGEDPINEEHAFIILRKKAEKLNFYTEKVSDRLKNSFWNLVFLGITLSLNTPSWIPITFSVVGIISFLSASAKYNDKKILLKEYEDSIIRFRDTGILNKGNSEIVKNIEIKYLWFE